ncbi:MAG: hypothetical protein A4E48_00792 [Methanosaeta sp. PtaU1.Bin060]|nr:MAG: hypothetical protein A4E48_00792 [Methanosaeta sp. PtaU1.Bin060]
MPLDPARILASDMDRYLQIFERETPTSSLLAYRLNKQSLALWFVQWIDLPRDLRREISFSLVKGWRRAGPAQKIKDSRVDLDDLADILDSLNQLVTPYDVTPGTEYLMPWIMYLDTLRYLPSAGILRATDLKNQEAGSRIQVLLLKADRYLCNKEREGLAAQRK